MDIVTRLKQLAHAVADEDWSEFSMRVPADSERDADLVLLRASKEIESLRAELAECRRISVARQVHIERLCRRNKFQCAANGCPGCAVCGPVAALAAKGE